MRITQALLAEHVVYHNLFDCIEQTLPHLRTLSEVRTLGALLDTMLRIHAEAEDELLIEPLDPSFSQLGQRENLHAEHVEIDTALAGVQSSQRLIQAKRLLLKAVVVSRKHFDREERIVFPLAEKQLSARSQELLGKRWAKQRKLAFD